VRKKLIALSFALASAAAVGLFPAASSEAAGSCNFRVCCPDGRCFCCVRPCSPQCP
jgi:hypothetical protein